MNAIAPVTLLDQKPIMSVDVRQTSASAFGRLPDEIIQQILLLTDPNSFASLIILNSKWRRVSQQPHLYALHLLQCPATRGFKPSPAAVGDDDLPKLRRLFAQQVKRNLFEAYVRPSVTNVTIISNSISSSSAPGGDGLQFSASPKGHHLLAYNSSRIYVLDVKSAQLSVKRELKILRRPVSACILDDGSLLAVLSTDMQVELYDLRQFPPRRKQALMLDHAPRAIALSPCGSVLAAAYEGGIEVSSITAGALPTDRRAVKCDAVDVLAFSSDGTQLLGTTTASYQSNTVILTAPYYDPGSQMAENDVGAMWTTSILFPNTSRDCSHAVLLQESSAVEAEWAFTYDRSFETFRAVRIDDLRNGTTYFPGPIPSATSQGTLLPSTLPSASFSGELVSAGFETKDVWIYGVPEDLEAIPEANHTSTEQPASTGLNRNNSGPSNRSASRSQEAQTGRVPQWQVLCDKLRNNFVAGRKVLELPGIGNVKWVSNPVTGSLKERLIVSARGVAAPKPITEEDDIDFVDGGRITILDFDYSVDNGSSKDITIDVGTKEPEVLEEEQRDLDTEVAIVRRRTVAQRRGGRSGVTRSSTTAHQPSTNDRLRIPAPTNEEDNEDPLVPRPMATARIPARTTDSEDVEDATLEEVQEALDAPYAHADPRSGTTLRRAATAAAMSRQRAPQPAAAGPVEYRRADGRREHPHESDADNWVPPPPPYAKEDPGDLPAFLRHPAIPGAGLGQSGPQSSPHVPRVQTVAPTPTLAAASRPDLPRIQTSPTQERRPPVVDAPPRNVARPVSAASATIDFATGSRSEHQHRPSNASTQPGVTLRRIEQTSVYNVSPPGSPPQAASRISADRTSSRQSSGPAMTITSDQILTTPGSRHGAGSVRHLTRQPSSDMSNSSRLGTSNTWNESQSSPTPRFRRLSNAFTWPRAPQPPQGLDPSWGGVPAGYPYSAPVIDMNNDQIIASNSMPLPRADQVASLHHRQDSGPPRRASGVFQTSLPARSGNHYGTQSNDYSHHNIVPPTSSHQLVPAPEQPLIISTPTGILGAFDVPDPTRPMPQAPEPILHAPVPRHPRPTPGSGPLRPTAERLETIYSPNTADFGQQPNMPGPAPNQLTASSLRYHTSMTRRESRARRSAARNMLDAKGRGWSGHSNKKKKKKKKDHDGASTAGWTDVTWASLAPTKATQSKEKKCIVM